METVDAVVIGSEAQRLVAANLLVDAGWSVLVLEAQDEVGGAVRSARDVHADYVHDTFSSFYPLSAVSPVVRGCASRSTAWPGPTRRRSPARRSPTAPGGCCTGAPRTPPPPSTRWHPATATPGCAPARTGSGSATRSSVRCLADAAAAATGSAPALPRVGGLSFVRSMLTRRTLADDLFTGQAAKMLLVGNAGHADIPMDAPGSGLFGCAVHARPDRRLPGPGRRGRRALDGDGPPPRAPGRPGPHRDPGHRSPCVSVASRRCAPSTETRSSYGVPCRRRVRPGPLRGARGQADLPARLRTKMSRFEWDPGTVKVDWALDGPVPWTSAPEQAPGTVHVAETVEEVVLAGAQVGAGAVPADPFLLMGQMAAADPSRAPQGSESVWAYTHVPQRTTTDAGPGRPPGTCEASGTTTTASGSPTGCRPGSRSTHPASPTGWSPGGCSAARARGEEREPRRRGPQRWHRLDAPAAGVPAGPGAGRAETPVRGLYLGSASAHPGGGVHGACGANAARAALGHARLGRLTGMLPGTARP